MLEQILKEKIKQWQFGVLPDGRDVTCFELSNKAGIIVRVLNYGGILQSILAPDRNGEFKDIVLGYDDLDGYLNDKTYQGALVGRYANRIAGAQFRVEGNSYILDKNEGENCLHGGSRGFNRKMWDAQIIVENGAEILRLQHVSPDGDQGFPGELDITADYSLNDKDELLVHLSATTDQTTIISLTMHPYFNLCGDSEHRIFDHVISLNSNKYLPIDDGMNPLGVLLDVKDSPFDFRLPQALRTVIDINDDQLKIAEGYDHCFCRSIQAASENDYAKIFHPGSGRVLRVNSDAPGIQFYTGNHLSENVQGKAGKSFTKYGGVCLEPQEFPNAPNEPGFEYKPLQPGEVYSHSMTYHFSIDSMEKT